MTLTREEELAKLVKEQQRDMQYGSLMSFRDRQGCISLTDDLSKYLTNQGFRNRGRDPNPWVGCFIHGNKYMKVAPPTHQERGQPYYCYQCRYEYHKGWIEQNRERWNSYNREWRQRVLTDPEKHAHYRKRQNEWAKKKRATDPEWAERQRANNRRNAKLSRQRKKLREAEALSRGEGAKPTGPSTHSAERAPNMSEVSAS